MSTITLKGLTELLPKLKNNWDTNNKTIQIEFEGKILFIKESEIIIELGLEFLIIRSPSWDLGFYFFVTNLFGVPHITVPYSMLETHGNELVPFKSGTAFWFSNMCTESKQLKIVIHKNPETLFSNYQNADFKQLY
ncbi:hypothetical protein ACFSO7_22465 [Bacillus sp. CGMCC 1.16607]|uniref:hypothetical protein n=1 Tax=Bacillus sp. CGMCC 1.16607 TaxID=3351842 RepID=UPI00362FDDB1